ncbi:MAG: AI-2E family transporter, partial [Eudoraea sp.]|uniref:AI-2E family transporter n=1 Tax=Eudoraea sp. TaxID=1979955 RepID=UPI003C732F05
MNSKMISDGILRAIAVVSLVLLICYFFFKISTLLIYIAIAVVISLIGRPVVVFLRTKLKMRNTLAVIVTMVLFLGIVIGVVLMFIPLLIKQGQNLSLLNIDALQQNLENLYREVTNYFGITTIDIKMQLRESKIFSKINFGVIPEFLNS